MADGRLFFKVDVGYFMNPKVHAIRIATANANRNATGNATGDAPSHGNVIAAHIASIAYSAQHRTDGVIPYGLVAGMAGASEGEARILGEVGLWHFEGHDCPECPPVSAGQAYVHDFLRHNESREQMERRSKAGRAGASARWGSTADANRNANRNATANANRNADSMRTAMQRREEKRREETVGHDYENRFDEFWSTYPKRVAKQGAMKKFGTLTKTVDPEVIIAGAKRYAQSMQGKDAKYIAHPTTWLNQGRWEDEITTPPMMSEEEARDRLMNPYKYQ